jgi:MFS family permease
VTLLGARESLWRNGDFLKLWGGETLSQVGSQVTMIALPLTAILVLDAGPVEVGLLATAGYAPILVVSLFAGSWLDRHRRRPAMIAAHAGRAVLLALVPLLYVLDLLAMAPLLAIAFAVGALTAFFDIAYITYVPQLVTRDQLVDANAKLESTYTIAEVGGPGIGGVLVQTLTAPVAILADVVTYVLAGILGARIKHVETPPAGPTSRVAIKDGILATLRHPVLRPVVLQSAAFNLFVPAIITLFLLYGVRELGLPAGVLGLILATGAVGGLAGTIVARRIALRLGVGPTMVWSMLLSGVALVAIPAASGPTVLVIGLVLHGFGLAVFNVHSLSVRAMVIPSDMLGRVTATYRFISNGTLPLAGVLAGALGAGLGVRPAMAVAAVALVVCCVLFVASGARSPNLGGDA